MKLIASSFNPGEIGTPGSWTKTWLANRESDIPANHDPEGAVGSKIIAIDTGALFIKNTEGKWQKFGSTTVLN